MKVAYVSHALTLAAALWSSQVRTVSSSDASSLYPDHVSALMNLDADPCEDFFEYACGTWYKNTELPEDRPRVAYSFNAVSDAADKVLREILENDAPVASDLYKACMDTSKLNQLGTKPIAADLKRVKDAKTIEDLMKLVGEFNTRGMGFLTKLQVGNDYFDAKNSVLFLTTGKVTLPSAKYYTGDVFTKKYEKPLREYITTLFKLSEATADEAEAAADAVIRVESKFIRWAATKNAFPYWQTSIEDASKQYPLLIGSYFAGTGALTESSLTGTSPVVNMQSGFYGALETFLADEANLEDIRTYVTYRWLNMNTAYLSEDFQTASFKFYNTALNGIKKPAPRWKTCVGTVTAQLPDMMGQYFSDKKASATAQSTAKTMIEMIEAAMEADINTTSWLDDETREKALAKLHKVSNLVGHSTHKESFDFPVMADAFAEDHHKIEHAQFIKSMNRVGKPVDKSVWSMTASEANAYYSPLNNQMVFPIGIFQNPFFDPSFPAAENFGAIGAVVGHELTHGFDSSGRNFDGDGNFKSWWTAAAGQEFDARAQCMIDQYSSFPVNGVDGTFIKNVNGKLTIGENIADNGGMKLAYNAYHEYIKHSRRLQQKQQQLAPKKDLCGEDNSSPAITPAAGVGKQGASPSVNTTLTVASRSKPSSQRGTGAASVRLSGAYTKAGPSIATPVLAKGSSNTPTVSGVKENKNQQQNGAVHSVEIDDTPAPAPSSKDKRPLEFDPIGPDHSGNPDQPNQFGIHKMPPPIKQSGGQKQSGKISSSPRPQGASSNGTASGSSSSHGLSSTPTQLVARNGSSNSSGSGNGTVLLPTPPSSPVPSISSRLSPSTLPDAASSLTESASAAIGNGFESDELFFVAYAQNWCTKQTNTAALTQILTDEHAPARWRVNGVVMNSRDFSRVFKCAANKPMNPPKKCEIW